LIFDEGLLLKTDRFIELAHLPIDDPFDDFGWPSRRSSLRTIDIVLVFEGFSRYVFLADKLWISRRDVHGDIVDQSSVVALRHKLASTVHFDEDSDPTPGMDVAGDRAGRSTMRDVCKELTWVDPLLGLSVVGVIVEP
jgi:hypothetical protein